LWCDVHRASSYSVSLRSARAFRYRLSETGGYKCCHG
jgi:hypothetical protein